MAVKDTLKFYCCTLQGLLRLKLIIGLVLGLLIMLAAILTLINPVALINPFNYLRQVWNAVFGFLILAAQPGWQKIPICSKILGRLVSRFGFLNHWLGRGLFYLLCAPPLDSRTRHHSPPPLTAHHSPHHRSQRRHRRDEPRRWPRVLVRHRLRAHLHGDRRAVHRPLLRPQGQKEAAAAAAAVRAALAPYGRTGRPAAAPSSRDEGAPPVPTSDTPQLPDGWKPAVDASGNTYYYNEATGLQLVGADLLLVLRHYRKSLARAAARGRRLRGEGITRLHVLHALGLRLGDDLDPGGHVTKRTSSPDATAARASRRRCRASPSRRCRLTGRTRMTFWPASDLSSENSKRSLAAFQRRALPPVEVGAPREADDGARWPRSGRWASATLTRSPPTTTAFAQSSSVISSGSAALGASRSAEEPAVPVSSAARRRGVATGVHRPAADLHVQ